MLRQVSASACRHVSAYRYGDGTFGYVATRRRADPHVYMEASEGLQIPIKNIFPQLTGPITGLVWLCQL